MHKVLGVRHCKIAANGSGVRARRIGGPHRGEPRAAHCGAPGFVDLGRVAESFGAGQHRRQPDLQVDPAVVVLASQSEPVAVPVKYDPELSQIWRAHVPISGSPTSDSRA